jgi:hypothetical protein
MCENTQLVNEMIEKARQDDGSRKLTCAEAFRLADRFGVEKLEIGRIRNAHNIRISNCQLGCFK